MIIVACIVTAHYDWAVCICAVLCFVSFDGPTIYSPPFGNGDGDRSDGTSHSTRRDAGRQNVTKCLMRLLSRGSLPLVHSISIYGSSAEQSTILGVILVHLLGGVGFIFLVAPTWASILCIYSTPQASLSSLQRLCVSASTAAFGLLSTVTVASSLT